MVFKYPQSIEFLVQLTTGVAPSPLRELHHLVTTVTPTEKVDKL